MYNVKTVFKVHVYPHPSKRKNGVTNETIESPGYGHNAAAAVDKYYADQGLKTTKVLAGFVINDKFVEADLTSPYEQSKAEKKPIATYNKR